MVRAAAPRDLGPMPETPPSSPDPHDAPTSQQPAPEDPTTEAPRPEPTAGLPAPRRLLRTRDDRVLGGVCSGLARYFNIDPLIIRIAAVALIFVGGFAVIAYIAALLLVPEDDGTGQPVAGKPGRFSTIAGAVRHRPGRRRAAGRPLGRRLRLGLRRARADGPDRRGPCHRRAAAAGQPRGEPARGRPHRRRRAAAERHPGRRAASPPQAPPWPPRRVAGR